MKKIALFLAFFSFGAHAGNSIDDSIVLTRDQCGFDLSLILDSISSVKVMPFSLEGREFVFELKWKVRGTEFHGELLLACSGKDVKPDQTSGVTEPKALINDEDSGGRYFRHVAYQVELQAINWKAMLASVDFVVGDNARSPVNEYLICDATIMKPCMTVKLIMPRRSNMAAGRAVTDLIKKIASWPPRS